MPEKTRVNLFDVLLKSLTIANWKTFIHRIIYIVKYKGSENSRRLLEENIKEINDDESWKDVLTGIGLFYPNFIVNIIEGSEDMLRQHILTVVRAFSALKSEVKILIMVPHLTKRYLIGWRGTAVSAPVLLPGVALTDDPQQHIARAQECILKIYQLCEHFTSQSEEKYRGILADVCKKFLPEEALLEFLMASSMMLSGDDLVRRYLTVPAYRPYNEHVWPVPPDFVPSNFSNY